MTYGLNRKKEYTIFCIFTFFSLSEWIWYRNSLREIQKIISVSDEYKQKYTCMQKEIDCLKDEKKNYEEQKKREQEALQQGELWEKDAHYFIDRVQGYLTRRQELYCSYLESRDYRKIVETTLLVEVAKSPVGAEFNLLPDIKDIFEKDTHCADLLNKNSMKNGNLMWVYLQKWRVQAKLQKYKRAMNKQKESLSGK